MKTATIQRYPIFGTPYYSLNMLYRGFTVWQEVDKWGIREPMKELTRIASLQENGFTHFRFTGDWDGRTKPRNGKIMRGTDE